MVFDISKNEDDKAESGRELVSDQQRVVMCDGTVEDLSAYDKHDQQWMRVTKKYPPTAKQLAIAFSKHSCGVGVSDEIWCEYDQDALDYCNTQYT